MRRVDVDPSKSLNYKITSFKDGVRNSRNLFTKETLKGGPITPAEIVDAYINSNRALYEINRRMFLDIDAAKVLGMNEDAISTNMSDRGERRAFNSINEGEFRPLSISQEVKSLFQIRADDLGVSNPFEAAEDVIGRIREVLETTPLGADLFPDIQNPLRNLPEPTLGPAASLPGLPAMPNPGLVNNAQFGSIDPVSGLTLAEETYLSPLEQNYRKKTRTT